MPDDGGGLVPNGVRPATGGAHPEVSETEVQQLSHRHTLEVHVGVSGQDERVVIVHHRRLVHDDVITGG